MKVRSFEETVKELAEINGKTVREVFTIVEEIANEYKLGTEFVKQLFLRIGKVYPYAVYVLKNYYGKEVKYSTVRRLFYALLDLDLIVSVGKYEGKGRFPKHLFAINEKKVNAKEWQNPLKYWYQMHGWKSYELRNIKYRRSH